MYESFTLYTAVMDRTHTVFAVLLNLFSVQLTFCGSADPMLFLQSPPTLSRGAHPFIQAQFHPASGTIQQGIMLPREHIMPLERIPEELYYQGRMMPEDSMIHERRIVPQQHFLSHESTESQEYMTPQETTISEQRILPPESIQQDRTTQTTMDHLPSLETAASHQQIMPSQQELQESRIQERFNQENGKSQQRMVAQENIQKMIHTSAPRPHSPKQDEQMTNDVTETRSGKRLEEDLRAVKSGYEYPHAPYPQSPYGYTPPRPSYTAPASSAPYSPPTSTYTPPAEHSESPTKDLLKPDLSELIKPVTGKIAGKLNGLVGLLSLFGSGKGLELGGIKDLLFEGILKPLLVAKGGLKALISKLAIPVVALILINVEVLITVWWLWEDCPEAKPVEYSKPSYPAPSYNYR